MPRSRSGIAARVSCSVLVADAVRCREGRRTGRAQPRSTTRRRTVDEAAGHDPAIQRPSRAPKRVRPFRRILYASTESRKAIRSRCPASSISPDRAQCRPVVRPVDRRGLTAPAGSRRACVPSLESRARCSATASRRLDRLRRMPAPVVVATDYPGLRDTRPPPVPRRARAKAVRPARCRSCADIEFGGGRQRSSARCSGTRRVGTRALRRPGSHPPYCTRRSISSGAAPIGPADGPRRAHAATTRARWPVRFSPRFAVNAVVGLLPGHTRARSRAA